MDRDYFSYKERPNLGQTVEELYKETYDMGYFDNLQLEYYIEEMIGDRVMNLFVNIALADLVPPKICKGSMGHVISNKNLDLFLKTHNIPRNASDLEVMFCRLWKDGNRPMIERWAIMITVFSLDNMGKTKTEISNLASMIEKREEVNHQKTYSSISIDESSSPLVGFNHYCQSFGISPLIDVKEVNGLFEASIRVKDMYCTSSLKPSKKSAINEAKEDMFTNMILVSVPKTYKFEVVDENIESAIESIQCSETNEVIEIIKLFIIHHKHGIYNIYPPEITSDAQLPFIQISDDTVPLEKSDYTLFCQQSSIILKRITKIDNSVKCNDSGCELVITLTLGYADRELKSSLLLQMYKSYDSWTSL